MTFIIVIGAIMSVIIAVFEALLDVANKKSGGR